MYICGAATQQHYELQLPKASNNMLQSCSKPILTGPAQEVGVANRGAP